VLAAALGTAAYAQIDTSGNAGATHFDGVRHGRGGCYREIDSDRIEPEQVLRKLNLSVDQQMQIKAMHAQTEPQLQSLFAVSRSTRAQLAATPPTDPNYNSLVATAKVNAAAAIQLRSDAWSHIYALLTQAQQAQIPMLLAAQTREQETRAAHED
jgi:Spy/CpxP family protein refolding chaperone